ncbi:DEAD/DEAH box helicase [Citreicella sp. C3M06]|uniref:DEAD/DEAH box helicase n=1 Tax=Citreicella sp. C3M06 TaxID=2841564 RepID=UPI001C08AD7D|nr:DEAD/DEAH box helicase [Citreicella sp. C3M06]MBU2963564.1 DEAD/DEAH box helicase [Citreicella sp. C3M06]
MITSLSEALAERGFDTLTPVQEAVSNPDLASSDLLVSAQTGSGKTVGFGLAIAPTLLGESPSFGPAAEPMALVIAPTRELASQVKAELSWLYARTGASLASCVGGMDARQERRALERGAHIVVGTPGRLRDHIQRGALDLSGIRAVVLDEADEMLDLGFREDLEFILGEAPEDRRTLLFSATVPPAIAKLAETFQRDAQRVSTISNSKQHSDIEYLAVRVAAPDAEHGIFNMLRFHHDKGAIVFANTRAQVNHLTARLTNRGLSVVSLSGELSQDERTRALQSMRDGRARVCVATDVAARGIDLPNLNLVIHADLPTNTESLLHRSGRTGRAGRKGISALIVPPRVAKKAERLLKWAKIDANWVEAPSADAIRAQDEARLLADPTWDEAITAEESAFAATLLAQRSPEVIAAAYLRLHQSRQAAPEDLLPADAKPEKRAPREFGPSKWISLSVGRDNRAEARWLLPLLCRAGNLSKDDIGAIRVQEGETFVELTQSSVDGFVASLGDGGLLEDGISARVLDSVPEFAPQPRRDGPRGPRSDGPRGPRPDRPRKDRDEGERKPRPPRGDDADRAPRPKRDDDAGRAPREHRADRPDREARGPRPERKPLETGPDAPHRAPRVNHGGAGKPARPGKPDWAAKGGPKSGPRGPKPDGAPRASANDTSKRFTPPGGKPGGKPGPKGPGKPAGKFAKPGGKPNRPVGGGDTPRRGKRP